MLKFCFDLRSTEQQSHRFFFKIFFPPSVEKNVFDERYRFWEPAALNADSEDNEDKQTDEDDLSNVTILPGPAFVQLVRADVQPELEGLFDRHRGCRHRFKVDATFEDQFQFKVLRSSHSIVTTSSRRRRLIEVQLVWRHSLTFGRAFLLWSIRWVSASIFFFSWSDFLDSCRRRYCWFFVLPTRATTSTSTSMLEKRRKMRKQVGNDADTERQREWKEEEGSLIDIINLHTGDSEQERKVEVVTSSIPSGGSYS